jgi:hypothetical protein
MNNFNPNFYMSVHTCSNMSNQRLSNPFDDAKVGIKKRPRSSGTFWEKIGNVWEDFGKKLLVSYPRLQHFI